MNKSTGSLADSPSTDSLDGRSARWNSHREERRRELIRAARRAVHRLGAEASMEDIAAMAGTSKSVFYRYFGDKAGLQKAVGEVVIARMQAAILAAGRTAATPREGLANMVRAYLEMAQTSPQVYLFVTSGAEDVPGTPSAVFGGFFDALIELMSAPLRHLLGDPDSPLLGYWPTAAIGLVRSAGERWLRAPEDAGKPDAAAMAEQITGWLFDGVWNQLSPTLSTDKGMS